MITLNPSHSHELVNPMFFGVLESLELLEPFLLHIVRKLVNYLLLSHDVLDALLLLLLAGSSPTPGLADHPSSNTVVIASIVTYRNIWR